MPNSNFVQTNKSNDEDSQLDTFIRMSFPVQTLTTTDYVELAIGSKPRYVCVENYTDLSKFEWFEGVTVDVAATAIAVNTLYTIKTVGTTDWVALGAPSSTVGVQFLATVAGTGTSGTGVAVTNDNVCIKTVLAGTRSLVLSNSILVRDRTVQLSQNATTAIISSVALLASAKDLSVRASG